MRSVLLIASFFLMVSCGNDAIEESNRLKAKELELKEKELQIQSDKQNLEKEKIQLDEKIVNERNKSTAAPKKVKVGQVYVSEENFFGTSKSVGKLLRQLNKIREKDFPSSIPIDHQDIVEERGQIYADVYELR